MRPSMILVSASLAMAIGCADERTSAPPVAEQRATPAPVEARATPAEHASWRDRVAAAMQRLERDRPEALATLRALEPHPTRARTLRFAGAPLRDPDAAAVLLHRLMAGGEPPAQRAAIADALPRTGGAFADAIPDLIAGETNAGVRAALVTAVWRAPKTDALAAVRVGLTDGDAAVRAAAARTAERHEAGTELAAELRLAVDDRDPRVRAAAVRALGVHRVAGAAAILTERVDDADAEVRLQSLRALERVGASLAVARDLTADPDPRVRRLATRMVGAAR